MADVGFWTGMNQATGQLANTGMKLMDFQARRDDVAAQQQIERDRLKMAQDQADMQKTAFENAEKKRLEQEALDNAYSPASFVNPNLSKSPRLRNQVIESMKSAGFKVNETPDGEVYAPNKAWAYAKKLTRENIDAVKMSVESIHADLLDQATAVNQKIAELQASGKADEKTLAPLLQQQADLKKQLAQSFSMSEKVLEAVAVEQGKNREQSVDMITIYGPDGATQRVAIPKSGAYTPPTGWSLEKPADSKTTTMKDFEVLYPDMASKRGTEDYASAYKKYQQDIQEGKIKVAVEGATARGAAYANERFYSMYDTQKGQTVKVKGNAINEDTTGRYLDPQDPTLKSDTQSLQKITKGMDSVNAFEKGAKQALDYTLTVAEDFGLKKYPKANTVSQLFQYHTGDPKVKGLKNAITTAATEYMKVINAGSDLTAAELSVMGQQRAQEIINSADNFESLKNSVKIMQREMQISGDKFKAQRIEIQGRLKGYGSSSNGPSPSTQSSLPPGMKAGW